MNFFQSQENARRRTSWLVGLFALAVICLIGLTQLLLMATLHYGSNTALTMHGNFWSVFSWTTLSEIAAVITSVVVVASLYKMQQLRKGGSAIALLLGGHLIERTSTNRDEQKILNVVEEMAIASGVAVPQVYLLEEASINAFAAGHDSRDVAIGITRGAIQLLNRDELQGVVAHEFSHIFNGDMKINLQLIGWLHGILFIGLIGRYLLDSSNSHSRRQGKGNGPLILLGLGLIIIGYCGTFFGNLIKAGISRQREFLADASAVQFTRNPEGIAGALKKMGGHPMGSSVMHPNASQVNHLFFGEGLLNHFSWFSTHPALDQRIRAILPRWDGELTAVDASNVDIARPRIDPNHVHIINGEIQYVPLASTATPLSILGVTTALGAIGSPNDEHIRQARQALDSLSDNLQTLARESLGASAIVHCLLMAPNTNPQEHCLLLKNSTVDSIDALCEKIRPEVSELPITLRLPLIDLCLPSLIELGNTERDNFLQTIMEQIQLDKKVSLFEWALYRLLRHHLGKGWQAGVKLSLSDTRDSCINTISAMAIAAHPSTSDASKSFEKSWAILGLPAAAINVNALNDMAALDKSVRKLHRLQPLSKPRLLKACCAAIMVNEQYAPDMVELLRAISDTIDAPIPPIVTNEKNAA